MANKRFYFIFVMMFCVLFGTFCQENDLTEDTESGLYFGGLTENDILENTYKISDVQYNFFTYQHPVNENELFIEDTASLLSDDEAVDLIFDMFPILQYGNVMFFTNPVDVDYPDDASNYAKQAYNRYFEEKSGTIFMIDMCKRRVEIWSYGDVYKVVNSARANIIATNIYSYATDEKYYDCAAECFHLIQYALEGGRVSTPLKYVTNFLISLCAMLLLMSLVLYSSRTGKKLSEKTDAVLYSIDRYDVPKVKKCKMTKQLKTVHSSSSGGGHGGGHGGGGGGGHGF